MFFVIPEMPSKTFVMVLKELPDHFNARGKNIIHVRKYQQNRLKNLMISSYNKKQMKQFGNKNKIQFSSHVRVTQTI